jgi:type I restriction enzyme S subunit
MPGEVWQRRTLEQCATFLSGGTPAKSRADYWTGSIPWVSAKDLKVFRLHDAKDHVTADAIDAGSRLVPAGSILLLVRGMTLHNDIPICVAMCEMAFNQDIKALMPKAGVDATFLTYWLLSQKPGLLRSVDSAGHGTGRLNTDTLKAMTVDLPPLAEQRAIAGVLGALDDKIELNRRMNATLESMARALFQSWFVDFDPVRAKLDGRRPVGMDEATAALFPHSFQDSELGPIPKGWNVGRVAELANFSRVSLNPTEFPTETFDHYSLPAFDDGRSPRSELGSAIMSNKLVVNRNSVLLSKLNPHIPRIWLPDLHQTRRSVCSTEFIVASARPGHSHEFLFSLFTSKAFASTYGTLITGTTGSHQRIRAESVLEMKTVIPLKKTIETFTTKTKQIFEHLNSNIDHSRTLATLRDTLLPRLLSGELANPQTGHPHPSHNK